MEVNPEIVSTVTVLGITLIFILIIVAGSWYSSSGTEYIINTPQSQDKMAVIDASFRSLLGNNWVYVLFLLTILVAGCLYFLYLASINDMITISVTEKQGNALVMAFGVLSFAVTGYIAQIVYRDYSSTMDEEIPYYTTQEQEDAKAQRKLIMQVIGLGIFVILLVWFIAWYLFFK